MTSVRTPLRSGALARLAGVSADTLHFYERRGLLPRPPRDGSGYRQYPQSALVRVRVIRQALDAGFTVGELARVFKLRDAGGAPCRDVLRIARVRLEELEEQIAELSALRQQLRRVIGEWETRLAITPAGRQAGLLDGLADASFVARSRGLRRSRQSR
jgi:DNA-binding transcriptional MerR regulator